jgi:pimeloyl-ACP methyl ester carboxylesterase
VIALAPETIVDPRNTGEAYWSAKRAAMLASVYPSGLPAALPDVTTTNWAGHGKPTECASITRYETTSPGGRSGGTSAYVHRLNPVAAPVAKCLVFHTGHGTHDASGWWQNFCASDGSSIIRLMLAEGWTVLAVDLPNYGDQPTPQIAVVNGATVTQTSYLFHAPRLSTWPIDAPTPTRLYTDHVIAAMNAVAVETPSTRFALAGHSGGGNVAALLAGLDSRYVQVHHLQSHDYTTEPSGQYTDWEGYSSSELGLAASRRSITALRLDLMAATACFPGRTSYVHFADNDGDYGDHHAEWIEWIAQMRPWAKNVGAELIGYRKTTGVHDIDATQASYVRARLLEM